jgi:hypothetical protein
MNACDMDPATQTPKHQGIYSDLNQGAYRVLVSLTEIEKKSADQILAGTFENVLERVAYQEA